MRQILSIFLRPALLVLCAAVISTAAYAQTTTFTFQGRLSDSSATANGTYDLGFALFDAATGGTQIGAAQTRAGVAVSNGVFTVRLDFGAEAFSGTNRFLEIAVKRPADASFTTLAPRQPVTSTPYAIRALNAATADTATNATTATNAATATSFAGNLKGDVSGTQTATIVDSVGGESAANVAAGARLANAATDANIGGTIVKRNADTGFAAGALTVSSNFLNVAVPDNTGVAVTITNPESNGPTLNHLLLRMRSNLPDSATLTDKFRFINDGGFVAIGDFGYGIIPASGAGTRFMWHPSKAAFRAGVAGPGLEFDEGNIGFYSWAGGYRSAANGIASFAFGDTVTVTGSAAVGFGNNNTVRGTFGFSAGSQNTCEGSFCTAIGFTALANGQAAIALGHRATANADYSVAVGRNVSTNGFTGAMVFGDASTNINQIVRATANNQFTVRASGGIRLRTSTATDSNVGANSNTGCDIPGNSGVMSCASSRLVKENFVRLDPKDVLTKIRRLPVTRWNYIGDESGERHIGPFAEDFQKAFKLSPTDKSIGMQDLAGVALVGVQALGERTADLQTENERLRAQIAGQNERIAAQQKMLTELEARLKRIEQKTDGSPRVVKRRNK